MGKTLSGQTRWFVDRIRAHRGKASLSVLISGCADYSAFAHAIAALQHEGGGWPDHIRIEAVDRCRTPLELNNHLSRLTGVPIVNHVADMLAFESDHPFDLIFTSSFLGFFTPAQRVELFGRYHRLLAPDGEVVFTTRTRERPENERVSLDAGARAQTIDGALALNRLYKGPDKLADDELRPRIEAYLAHFASYSVRSGDSLEQALRAGGFENITMEERMPVLPQHEIKLVGYTFAELAPYVCVTARKTA
jgi:SAM-dependent methyltransferase